MFLPTEIEITVRGHSDGRRCHQLSGRRHGLRPLRRHHRESDHRSIAGNDRVRGPGYEDGSRTRSDRLCRDQIDCDRSRLHAQRRTDRLMHTASPQRLQWACRSPGGPDARVTTSGNGDRDSFSKVHSSLEGSTELDADRVQVRATEALGREMKGWRLICLNESLWGADRQGRSCIGTPEFGRLVTRSPASVGQ